MAKGMSPLRLFMRNPSRKTVAESVDGSSLGPDGTGGAAQSRQPLGPLTETTRNASISVAEQPIEDAPTPGNKTKISVEGQEKFPHLENSEVHATSVNITPDKTASSKGKFTWQHRHGSTVQNVSKAGEPPFHTPPRPPRGSACSDGQAAINQDILQGLSHSLRGSSTGGGSVPSTPKTARSVGGKSTSESENGGSQSHNGTPCKSVSRSLKYGQQGSASNPGPSGLPSVRSTISQHVITRPMGYLQAAKGVHPQLANRNWVEHHFELEENASFWRDHNVQVIIRTRPLSNSELASQGSNRCVKQESPHAVSWLGQPETRFTFDHVAGETITQAQLFNVAGLPMVDNCMSGYNSCMFAYGQTGSGKTHTMLGDIEHLDRSPSENRGITPRVFEYLFARMRKDEECRRHEHLKFFCKCSFLEIYNEQITDLLEPSSTNLQMREDAKKGVYVEYLSEVEVQCVQDVIQLLLQGAANRKVAATNMNRESSRSHSVFTCVVESKWETNSMTNSRYGRLHLVDLAGSERQKSSGAEGGRLKEAANINKSLSTLGLVIMILVDVANGKQRHVPYRDSKLTFLLQDSLGGNSKTIMIANVSPSSCCAMETLSTLKFAQRAKFIRNNAVINEDASGDVIALRRQIEELKDEVDRLRRESILRVSSSRIFALENGPIAAQKHGDASTLNCNVIGNSNTSQTGSIFNNDKLRSIEAVLAGALRREQQAEDITKKLAAEIEQLKRLVRQREEDSQCSKMMLKFREEKIRRLEGIADNVMSTETFYEDERKNLVDELQLIRGRLDRNPELTRFAMENIRLMEELRRYQEFYDGGERDLLLEEISGLRSQLLDMLDTKFGEEPTVGKLLTPQKRAVAPDLISLERENELLLVEVKSYQNELKECRNNLNSCLVANADLSRELHKLQAIVKELQNERSQKHDELSELLISLDEEVPNSFSSGDGVPSSQETTSSADPATPQVRGELELQQRQALINVEEEVLYLRNQLKEAQDLIQNLSSESASQLSDSKLLKETIPCVAEDDSIGRLGLQERWEKLQEIEMRHSEEITQLQLELDSIEEVLREERQQRLAADEKSSELRRQLSDTVSKLEQAAALAEDGLNEQRQRRFVAEEKTEKLNSDLSAAMSKLEELHCVVEALEGQQLFSITEFENLQAEHTNLQAEHTKLLSKLELQNQFQDENTPGDPALSILEERLLRTERGKEEAKRINRQFLQEKASRMALDKEREVTMSEVETQAALAITTLQSEILDLREEVSAAVKSEATAKLEISHLQKEVGMLQQTIGQLEDANTLLSHKSDTYRSSVDETHAQLRALEADWESSASKLVDYLADGDKSLSEAVREMEEMNQTKIQDDENHFVGERDGESLYHRFQGVEPPETQTQGKAQSAATGTLAVSANLTFDDGEAMIRESETKAMAAFLMVGKLLERIKELKSAQHTLVQEHREAFSKEAAKDTEAAALERQLEDLDLQYGKLQNEHEFVIREREDLRQKVVEMGDIVNEFKADCIRLEKEFEQSCRATEEKDVENVNLHKQLNENQFHYTLMADRYQMIVAAHEKLQEEHARYVEAQTLTAKEQEEQVRLSERKAMAILLVFEEIWTSRNGLKATNIGLVKDIQDGRLLLEERQRGLATLEEKLEQDTIQYKEIAHEYQILEETHANLQLEHNRLLVGEASKAKEGEALVKLSEQKAMTAFIVVGDLLERVNELKSANACLTEQIGEAHVTLAGNDAALAALQNEQSEHSAVSRRYELLHEAHERLLDEHNRSLVEKVSTLEEGEARVKMSDRKALAAFVVLGDLLDRVKELKTANICLAEQIEKAHVTLVEKETALGGLQHELSKYSEVSAQHQALYEAHENLRQQHERLVEEHNRLLVVKDSALEEGEARVKLSDRKALAAFVVLGDLLDRVKELKTANICLAEQVGEAHGTLAEKDTALGCLQNELSKYSEVSGQHQALHEAHEDLRQKHDRLVDEHNRLLVVKDSALEEGEARVRMSEQKAMAAFVVLGDFLQRVKELKLGNTCLAEQVREAHGTLAERDTALGDLQNGLSKYSEVSGQHQALHEAHEDLRQQHDRLVEEHNRSHVENVSIVEEGKARVKKSEKKAMAVFVVLSDLLERVKDLKTAKSCLAEQIGEAHRTLAEKDIALAILQNELSDYSEVSGRNQVLQEAHENLRQEHGRLVEEHNTLLVGKASTVEEGNDRVKLSERKAMTAFIVVGDLLERVNELKSANSFLREQIGEAHVTLAGKDTALAALQNEQSEYSALSRRYEILREAHERLLDEHNRWLVEKVSTVEEGEAKVKMSEKKAMTAFVVLRDLLERMKELKTANTCLAEQIGEAQGTLAEKDIALASLQNDLSEYSEVSGRHQVLQENLRLEHERLEEDNKLLVEKVSTMEEGEGRLKLSEQKALAAFVVLGDLLEKVQELKTANTRVAEQIGEAHVTLAEKDTTLGGLQKELSKFSEVSGEHQALHEAHENLRQQHERLVEEHNRLLVVIDSATEEGEARVRMSEQKAMVAFVVLRDLLERVKELKTENNCLAEQIAEGHVTLSEKDIALAGLQNELSEYSEVSGRHQVLHEAHENLRQEHERLVEEHNTLLVEKVSTVEEGKGRVKQSEQKAMAAFVVLGGLLERVKELKTANSCLAQEIAEAHVTLAEKDTALGALQHELSECSDVSGLHQALHEAHENLRQDHERLVEEHNSDCLKQEQRVQSLLLEMQRLEFVVKEAELRVSEMLTTVEALTIEKENLEVENSRLMLVARTGETNCSEKELLIVAMQCDLANVRARLSTAEVLEQSANERMEELTVTTLGWEIERAVVEHEMQELQSHICYLSSEMEKREIATLDSFRRGQEVLEVAEARMVAMDEELARSGTWKGYLEHDMALVEAAASGDAFLLEEKELECLEMKRQLGAVVDRMQRAIDLATSQLALEMSNRKADKERMEEEKCACEVQLRHDIASTESILLSTQGTLQTEMQRLDSNLKQTESRVAEMLTGVAALTVALEELKLEKGRLTLAVSQAEMHCWEKEQQLVATQGDVAALRSRLMEAELHEKSLSGLKEELNGAQLRREVESAEAKLEVQGMRQDKDRLRFELSHLNAEVQDREKAVFESFRRSQQALEKVEARLTTMHQELEGFETSQKNLENELAVLDSAAATVCSVGLEENEHRYREMQRRVENAELQMYEMQAAADSAVAQIVLERDIWEAVQAKMKKKNDAREAELRDEIAAAELKLLATEETLKVAVESVEALGLSMRPLEEELLKLKADAKISISKVAEEQQEVDALRGMLMALKAECAEADGSIAALSHLREQYILAEAGWRSEQELLTRKLEELTVTSGRKRGDLSHCLPGSEDQNKFEKADQIDTTSQEYQVLRAKVAEKDRTILSAKKEMQVAIANLKEAELEMDKVHRKNHRLTQIQLENQTLIDRLSLKVMTTEEELLKRNTKIEGYEAELQKVLGVMSDWETKMGDVENVWRKEKEVLALELSEAKIVANEKGMEAGALLQKFHDGQATLKEAEHLVDALVKANETAKYDALEWKTEKENLGIVQGWWMPERDKLVSKLARLETDMHTQKEDIWIMCKEAVNGLVATMDILSVVEKKLSELKSDGCLDMEQLAIEMTVLKSDLVAGFLDLEGEMINTSEDVQSIVYELTSEKDRALKDFADLKLLEKQKAAHSLETMNRHLQDLEIEHQKDLIVLNDRLELALTLVGERETVAAEALEAAEHSKRHAEEKEAEARILERSVEELESTVYALESQLDIVKRESERQRVAREFLEKELEVLNRQVGLMQTTIDTQDAQTMRDYHGAETSKIELDRIVIEMKNQQIQARKSVESLQQECAEKDVQLRSCKAHIAELMLGAEKQTSENQLKLKTLEAMLEHLKVEERKVPVGGSVSKAVDKTTGKVKGAGSPFKCIGSGLEKQRSSEMDEELSAAKKRIKELETLAASRQKEVFMLNTKLAEAESMTHDVVRDLLGVKMDIASYATLLNQQQVQRIAERARRRTMEAQQKEDELDTLRDKLNELIEERESWLEEINRRQAETVAARVSAEKLRLRDETLTAEHEKLQEDCHSLRKKITDLDEEIKKLSGQQNLQQRIHHHAKIKEENNSIKLQNEEISGKLRRMEILFTRVNDELARYRTAEGRNPFINFDEEARLQKKLQETEENRLQLAETVLGLCTRVMQAAGSQKASRDIDPTAAMSALQQLEDRLVCLERELSDYKLKSRIAVETRRLSDLRELHTPVRATYTSTNFTANQELPSPVCSSR